MQNERKFNLIKGLFKPEYAKDLLLELYYYKISFHEKEKHSNVERSGRDLLNSESRIAELKSEREELKEFLLSTGKICSQLQIECIIKIKPINTTK